MKSLRMVTHFNHLSVALDAPGTILSHLDARRMSKVAIQGSWCVFKASSDGLNESKIGGAALFRVFALNSSREVCRG